MSCVLGILSTQIKSQNSEQTQRKILEMDRVYIVGEAVILYIYLRNTKDQPFSELNVDQEIGGGFFTELCHIFHL